MCNGCASFILPIKSCQRFWSTVSRAVPYVTSRYTHTDNTSLYTDRENTPVVNVLYWETQPTNQWHWHRNLLNNWEFVYFFCGLSPTKCRIVRQPNLARRRVPTMSRTSVGFCVYRGRRYENNDIFLQLQPCMPRLLLQWCRLRQWVGRSDHWPAEYQPAGWLPLALHGPR